MVDPHHYHEPIEQIEARRERLESLPIHIERIREELEALGRGIDRLEKLQDIRNEDFAKLLKYIESIDFGIYNAITPNTKLLRQVRNLLLIVIAAMVFRFFF